MKKTETIEDGTQAPEAPATELNLRCKVLVNGMLYDDAHHAAGKELIIPESKAEYLAKKMDPPQVEILTVA